MSDSATGDYVLNQTMLRIKDPSVSIPFYEEVLGMTMLDRFDFPDMSFSLYFLGYPEGPVPEDRAERVGWIFRQRALIELTHNHGSEDDDSIGYHDGNSDPRGFGHIGVSVPDVHAACERFERLGVEFVKRPNDGSMKGIAFVRDPDGYWIEILSPRSLQKIITDL